MLRKSVVANSIANIICTTVGSHSLLKPKTEAETVESGFIKVSDRVTHSALVHGRQYLVKTPDGHELTAIYNVYGGGEQVEFLHHATKKPLSITHFKEV